MFKLIHFTRYYNLRDTYFIQKYFLYHTGVRALVSYMMRGTDPQIAVEQRNIQCESFDLKGFLFFFIINNVPLK